MFRPGGELTLTLLRKVPISRRSRRALKRLRARVADQIGSKRYVWAALYDLDRRLVELFDGQRGGRFLEIGANDGLQQSNTLALERLYGWSGILIEANPMLAAECAHNRPDASVVCAAASDSPRLVVVSDADLKSTTTERAGVMVSAVTLSTILDELHAPQLDLISIDVEGAELDVVAGLDLGRHAPRFLLIETDDLDAVAARLAPRFRLQAQWTYHDYLFARSD